MAILPIVIAPDRHLKFRCNPVEDVTDSVRAKLDDMLSTMYDAPGIGLAAPQVSDDRRLIVIDAAREDDPPAPLKIINPEILWTSGETCVMSEGCLSIPDIYHDVKRPERVRVAYLDETGAALEVEADGLLSRCLQHEIDHLNGILFIDHISLLKRNMALKKMRKLKAEHARNKPSRP